LGKNVQKNRCNDPEIIQILKGNFVLFQRLVLIYPPKDKNSGTQKYKIFENIQKFLPHMATDQGYIPRNATKVMNYIFIRQLKALEYCNPDHHEEKVLFLQLSAGSYCFVTSCL